MVRNVRIRRRPGRTRPPVPELLKDASVLDRWAYWLSPKWGARRLMTRFLAETGHERLRAFHRGRTDETRGENWLGSRLSPNDDLELELEEVRDACQDLARKNSFASSAIEGRVASEVGTGITGQARVKQRSGRISESQAKEINDRLEDLVRRWSMAGADRTGEESLNQVQKQLCRSFAINGEAFLLFSDIGAFDKPIPLTLEVVAPERIETPIHGAYVTARDGSFRYNGQGNEVRLGKEYDGDGRCVAFYVRSKDPRDTQDDGPRYERVERLDATGQPRMTHVFDPLFPGQIRGIPWLAAAMQRFKDIDDVIDAEIIAKQVEACFAAFIKDPQGDGGSEHELAEGMADETDSDGLMWSDIRPGLVAPIGNKDIAFANPQRPGTTFEPFMQFSLRSIAAACNYPYEALAKNFFRTTFASGRLAMLDGRTGFRLRSQVLIDKALCWVWKRIVFEAVLVGELDGLVTPQQYNASPWLYEQHKWQPPGFTFINPKDEIAASKEGVEADITTLADVHAEAGKDTEEQHETRKREKLIAVEHEIAARVLRKELEEKNDLAISEEMGQPEEEEEPQPTESQSANLSAGCSYCGEPGVAVDDDGMCGDCASYHYQEA